MSARGRDSKIIVGELRGRASPRGSIQEADLDQERLINLFNCVCLFGQCRSQSVHPDRATLILLDDGEQQFAIDFVEAMTIDFQHLKRGLSAVGRSILPAPRTCA